MDTEKNINETKFPDHSNLGAEMCWVAVSERTPEINDLCLCYNEHGYSFRYWKGNHFEGEHIANEPKVTHWMYAPKPPCK